MARRAGGPGGRTPRPGARPDAGGRRPGLGRAAGSRRRGSTEPPRAAPRPRRAPTRRPRRSCWASTWARPARRACWSSRLRRGAGRRVPAHRRQPGRSRQAPGGRPARGTAARHGGGGRPDRARGATPWRPSCAPPTPTSRPASRCSTRSWRTRPPPCGFDPDGGRSLSIVEIGGQDAKFINVRDGRVVESDMNRVCSAGTGSFLEEQALALRARRHRRVRRPRGPLREAARPRPDLHGVRRRRGRRGAVRRLHPRRHLRRAAVLGDQELHRPRDGRPPLRWSASSFRASRPRTPRWRARWRRSPAREVVRAARPRRHGRAGHRPARREASGADRQPARTRRRRRECRAPSAASSAAP